MLDDLNVDEDTFENASEDCEDDFEDLEDWFEDEVTDLVEDAQAALDEIDDTLEGTDAEAAADAVVEQLYLDLLALEAELLSALTELANACA